MSTDYHLPKPCPGCPFLKHGPEVVRHLREDRLEEIVESEGGFACHRTVDYEEDEHGQDHPVEGKRRRECAGWLIYHLANGTPPQVMRIMGRVGAIDVEGLLEHKAEVITDFDALVVAHEEGFR